MGYVGSGARSIPVPRSLLDRQVGGSTGSGVRSNLLPPSMPDRLVRGAGSGVGSILFSPSFVVSRDMLDEYLHGWMKQDVDESVVSWIVS